MARSPQFVTGKNNTLAADSLTEMTLNLAIYSGSKAAAATNNYTLSKGYSVNEVINFEISDLVRSEFYHDFSIWNDIGYVQSPQVSAYGYARKALGVTRTRCCPVTALGERVQPTRTYHTDGWATMTNITPYGSESVGACNKP
jgi:hypothetical protein